MLKDSITGGEGVLLLEVSVNRKILVGNVLNVSLATRLIKESAVNLLLNLYPTHKLINLTHQIAHLLLIVQEILGRIMFRQLLRLFLMPL